MLDPRLREHWRQESLPLHRPLTYRVDGATTRATTAGGLAASCTLPWRAPEVALGGRATCESDVWSLGMVLLELVTRKHPFTGMHDDQIHRVLVSGSANPNWPHAPSSPDPTSPTALLAPLMEACWKEEGWQRPQATELKEALSMARLGVAAASPSPARRSHSGTTDVVLTQSQ